MNVRNALIGDPRIDALKLGDANVPAMYLGDDLIFGGNGIMTAADCGLTTTASIMYVDGECFGDPLKEVINAYSEYEAWGGYKFPQQWNNNGLTVIHYDAYPPAIYIPNDQTIVYHYGTVVPWGLYFVASESILIKGQDSYSGQGMSIHKRDTAYKNGALFRGPYDNPYESESDPRYYGFSFPGSPIEWYINQGTDVNISVSDTSAHMMLAGLLSANAGRRLTFEDLDN